VERVQGQLLQAYAGLEHEVQTRQPVFEEPRRQASITAAVVWQFTQSMLAPIVAAEKYPGLVALSTRMERTPEFLKYSPVGPGV
jgi:hypothetical protein